MIEHVDRSSKKWNDIFEKVMIQMAAQGDFSKYASVSIVIVNAESITDILFDIL